MSDLVEHLRQGISPPAGFIQTDAVVLQHAEEFMSQAADEIERLGRCNEQLSRSHAAVMNDQNAEIERLREELDDWKEAARVSAREKDDEIERLRQEVRESQGIRRDILG
jgi:hypothetical protein